MWIFLSGSLLVWILVVGITIGVDLSVWFIIGEDPFCWDYNFLLGLSLVCILDAGLIIGVNVVGGNIIGVDVFGIVIIVVDLHCFDHYCYEYLLVRIFTSWCRFRS